MRAITDRQEDAITQNKHQDNVNRLTLTVKVLQTNGFDRQENHHSGNDKKLTYSTFGREKERKRGHGQLEVAAISNNTRCTDFQHRSP